LSKCKGKFFRRSVLYEFCERDVFAIVDIGFAIKLDAVMTVIRASFFDGNIGLFPFTAFGI